MVKFKVRLLSVGTSPRDRKREPKSQIEARARSLKLEPKPGKKDSSYMGTQWNFLLTAQLWMGRAGFKEGRESIF